MQNNKFQDYNKHLLNETDYLKRARELDKQNYSFEKINNVLDKIAANQDMREIIKYIDSEGQDADIIEIDQNHSRENVDFLESAGMLEKPADRDIKLTWLSRLYLERMPNHVTTDTD